MLHSENAERLIKYFEVVLQTLQKHQVTVKLKKCRFSTKSRIRQYGRRGMMIQRLFNVLPTPYKQRSTSSAHTTQQPELSYRHQAEKFTVPW
jgi:hypothetical protein